ncbi:hypothetical protein QAD02_004840 [Eretmocerus hayati]|uniref:Uncharacterized protein n=1 Tax=Eretmocerus hayati TaxID=131215 RepID=A0ACC2NRW1_9HYME|nr:hypothetical protein QAD02_004840 [Eretmocerus hayati]
MPEFTLEYIMQRRNLGRIIKLVSKLVANEELYNLDNDGPHWPGWWRRMEVSYAHPNTSIGKSILKFFKANEDVLATLKAGLLLTYSPTVAVITFVLRIQNVFVKDFQKDSFLALNLREARCAELLALLEKRPVPGFDAANELALCPRAKRLRKYLRFTSEDLLKDTIDFCLSNPPDAMITADFGESVRLRILEFLSVETKTEPAVHYRPDMQPRLIIFKLPDLEDTSDEEV